MHNLYQILGVNKDASTNDIKKAYRGKALSEHPDKGGDAQRMALLTEAYQTLSDPIERKRFDQEWEVFNASYDTEISLTPPGCLPTAGIAFSKSFRQQHGQFVKQCRQKPLDQNQSSSYLKAFHSDLYSCNGNVADNLFSFIKAKSNLETKLDIGLLTPEKAVEYFINFLQGDYSGSNLQDLSKAFNQKIEQLETLGQQAGYEFQLYCGIHEILLVAAKEKTPTAKILFSLHKITEYAKHNADQTMSFMAPLLQSKYFRSLFSQVLHYYWLSEESVLDESYVKAFNGQAATESLIERLKSKLSESQSASKSNDQVAKLLRHVRLLFKLEQELSKSADITTTNRAVFYREKAFHLLDWLPSLMGFADHAITVNTLLQIGITLQKAAAQEPDPVLRMADEKLAAQIYAVAVGIGHHATPDVEFYAGLHSVKCLLSCRYTDSEFKEILEAFQHRALWIADLFPFFQAPQSNADFIAQEDKTLVLMRQLLHALIDKIDDQRDPAEIDHSYVRVVYQAYEACLKNWYQKSHDPEREKKFRQQLMQELLVSKQWTTDNINYNLNAPWPLTDLDEQGWTCPKSSMLSSAKKANAPTYKTIRGAEFNYKTGEIDFILDYCKDNESNYNRLLTPFDLKELFQRRLTSAIFSLDPVDPDMPYHPFNQMRFAPSTLYHSQLLHTMFITDYLLKFLTVGQEVQRRDPYELRSLDRITSKLPDRLKKVIYDFHASNHEESLHRFWIESEGVELAVDDEGLSNDGNVLFALGNIRMVVKHHKMKRDAEGNLVDKEGENEGWDCYILTREQKQELYNGKRIIEDPALIIVKDSWELIFWENNKATHRFTLEENKQDLIRLSKLQRDSQGKVKTDDSGSLRQIYRIVLKAAEKTGMPNRYSPEFIFAQEFTKHYDEFAIYFPEFGRLRELSKAASLVNVMAAQRAANQEEVHLIRRRLNYKQFCGLQSKQPWQVKEHNYWQTTRQELKEGDRGLPGPNGAQSLAGSLWPKSDKDSPWSKGDRGSPWLQGDKGFPGPNGAQGLAGSPWSKGDKGKQGPKGVAGLDGMPVPQEPVGPKGDMGNKGKIRVPGADGASGMLGPKQPWQVKEHNYWQTTRQELKEGDRGLSGPNGAQGLASSPWLKGDRGFPDQNGAQGLAGSLWPKSDKDSPWLQSDRGLAGSLWSNSPWPKSDKGLPGQNGAQGLAGSLWSNSPWPKSDKGLPGKNGAQGLAGSLWSNSPWPKSDKGLPGQNGAQGLAGSLWSNSPWPKSDKGLPGKNGTQGLAGSLWSNSPWLQGDKGEQGPKGVAGLDGMPVPQEPVGSKRDMGNKGEIRVQGALGKDCTPGADGASGMLGPKQPWQVKEHNYWQTTRQELKELVRENITKQFEEWRSKFSKEKIKEKKQELFNDLRRQIGTLKFTRSSPKIRDICDRCYDSIKSDIIAEHGYSGWNSVSHRVYREAIEPQIPKFIADLKAQKKAAYHKQLLKLFEDELNELSGREASQLLDRFLEGNDRPLCEHLVCYDRKLVAKKIKEIYPEHTVNILDRALNHSLFAISEIVNCETEKAVKEHEKQLRLRLSGKEKLEQSFTDLGFGDDTEEVNLEGNCSWVPASFRHDVDGGHSRTVYGGVSILGRIKECARQQDKEALLRQTREIAGRVITVDKIINKKLVGALFKQTSKDGKQVVENNIRGSALNKACEEMLKDLLSSDPRLEVIPDYPIKTPTGLRKLDLVVLKDGIPVQGIEIKAADLRYVRADSWQAELLGRKLTKQGKQDDWIEKERKDEDGGRFPITEVRVEKLTKDHCKVQ